MSPIKVIAKGPKNKGPTIWDLAYHAYPNVFK